MVKRLQLQDHYSHDSITKIMQGWPVLPLIREEREGGGEREINSCLVFKSPLKFSTSNSLRSIVPPLISNTSAWGHSRKPSYPAPSHSSAWNSFFAQSHYLPERPANVQPMFRHRQRFTLSGVHVNLRAHTRACVHACTHTNVRADLVLKRIIFLLFFYLCCRFCIQKTAQLSLLLLRLQQWN